MGDPESFRDIEVVNQKGDGDYPQFGGEAPARFYRDFCMGMPFPTTRIKRSLFSR